MLGALRIPLTTLFGPKILRMHIFFGIFTLLFATLHPLFFYIAFLMSGSKDSIVLAIGSYFGFITSQWYGYVGPVTWTIMFVTATTAYFRKKPFFVNHWRKIHLLNYAVFCFAFIHSFITGTELQFAAMKLLYLFFLLSFLVAISYKRILPLIRNRSHQKETGNTKIVSPTL